jgi:WD40 repeat protein/serine/threonine protein kinase
MSPESAGSAIRLKDLSASEYSRLSGLLDDCLGVIPAARAEWLCRLEAEDPRTAELLRKLFATSGAAEGLLETSDLLTRRLASFVQDEEQLAGKRVGPYRLLSLLGQGGMGSVWLAERADGLFARQVALKLVHPALVGRTVSERFAREREILASLSHPNIARLFDAGFAEDGQPYLALQYVAGEPITTYCDRSRLDINQRLQLFLQVLSAVQYAHANLVIHRDLKPSNILVTENGQAQLLDFGIAKLLTEGQAKETELTQLGGRALTPDYAAPEQIRGAPITTAADVYALGVMLYELLTGERPYRLKRDSRGALEEAILQAEPVSPSRVPFSEPATQARATTARRLSKALKGDLDTIVMKALKKAPAERYATANAFGEDVRRFLRGEVVLAQRDSVAYRTLKFARRHRVAIGSVSILILTLAGGLAATTYEARVAAAQRDATLQAQLRLLTQTADGRLKDADHSGALAIILEVLRHQGAGYKVEAHRSYAPEALSVFQEWRAADAQVLALTGHTDRVRSATFSPDGRRILTGSYDKTARVWDAGSGRQMMVLAGHTDRVTSAAFSPDGRRVATGSADNTARIWDSSTGREITLLRGHTERVLSVAFSPDSRFVVTGSMDKTARIWDAATGQQIRVLTGPTELLATVAFSPDGRRIVAACYDQTARVWDASTGRQITSLEGHTDRLLSSAAFSPDGRRIVTASYDKTARIWDAETGQQITTLRGHTDRLTWASFSPDGHRIVTAAIDKTVRIWDAETGQQSMLVSGNAEMTVMAAFSPDGRRIVTASYDKTARIWNAAPAAQKTVLNGHKARVSSASFTSDGRQVITASVDKTARLWDAETGQEKLVLTGHTDQVNSAAFSPDGRRIVTASIDKTARIWDAATGQQVAIATVPDALVGMAVFSPDSRRIITSIYDKTARIWDAATGHEVVVLRGHTDRVVNTAAFSPDGHRAVTASDDETVRIWNADTGRQITLLSGHTGSVMAAVFSPDGRRVVSASHDKTARIWDAASGQQILVLEGHTDGVETAAFSADQQRIVTASDDRTVRVWDAATGQELVVLAGHTGRVETAEFSPDGHRVVSASNDGTARVWDATAPALEAQISWAQAAQLDPLPGKQRMQLGLPVPTDLPQWPASTSKCDESAGAPYDPHRQASGVMLDQLAANLAIEVCSDSKRTADRTGRNAYQHGRALMARGKFTAAREDLERSVAEGYAAARVELGMLLTDPAAAMLDVPRAISLYETAWSDGVTIAAFQLGSLYENGVRRVGGETESALAPDETRAWFWYQKAAEAGQPNALARFGERDVGAAATASSPAEKDSHLLQSFRYYAAASERARLEDWPDDAWRNWRYRRASLARLLAGERMMQEVADVYEGVRKQYAPPPTPLWRRLLSRD